MYEFSISERWVSRSNSSTSGFRKQLGSKDRSACLLTDRNVYSNSNGAKHNKVRENRSWNTASVSVWFSKRQKTELGVLVGSKASFDWTGEGAWRHNARWSEGFFPYKKGETLKKKMIRDSITIYVFVTMDYPNDY